MKIDALVVGGDSRIGAALASHLEMDGLEVRATSRRNGWHRLELEATRSIHEVLRLEPTTTFICAAITSFAECEHDPDQAELINAKAPVRLARDLTSRGGRVVFLSSSAAETRMDSIYGASKHDAENGLLNLPGELVACVRFGPVAFPGRTVQHDGPFEPLPLRVVVQKLADLAIRFLPGLHRILAPSVHRCFQHAMT